MDRKRPGQGVYLQCVGGWISCFLQTGLALYDYNDWTTPLNNLVIWAKGDGATAREGLEPNNYRYSTA